MTVDLGPGTEYERRILRRLRELKADGNGHGHGVLRVDVVNGRERNIRREFGELLP